MSASSNAANDSADNGEGGNLFDRLFNNTRSHDREQSQSTVKGFRRKAFTLPFSLFNRRKRTSPDEVEDTNGGRRRAATDYSKKQREMQEAERREQQQQHQQPQSPPPQQRLVSSARYPPSDWGKPFDGSQPLDSLVDPANVPSSPTTPAATATPRPLQKPMLHAASREKMPNLAEQSASIGKGKGRASATDSPELSHQSSYRSSLHNSTRDEGYNRHLGQHKSSLTESRSGTAGQVPPPLRLTSPTSSSSAPRPRRPSFTLTARNGNLMVSDSYNTTTSASINTHASASPQPATTASSPGTKSSPSPPLARMRASTIQGATPILPSQRGIHGSTSAEALAQATGDNPFSLQRVRRTFSDAFKQNRARQQALERIGGSNAAATGGYRPQLQQTDERSENESRQSKRTDIDDAEDSSQQRDNEATLVAARAGQTPAKALPWTNAMLSSHHHLTPVGELPESMRLSMMSLQDQQQEDRVLSPTAAQQQQQRQPLSAGLTVSYDDRSRSQQTVDGTASKENTFRSNDVTAVDPAAPAPDLPSRKSSLSRLKAELVHSFLANARAAEGKEQQKRGGGVDTPFTPVYMSRERNAGGGGSVDKNEDDMKRNAGGGLQQQQEQPQPQPQHQHSPSNSSVAFSALGLSPPSHAHSSYHAHFSPTSTQQALYASKQRLIGPLEAQLAALDSQFNSMFHTLEVRRLESQYSELQRRIEEKKRIVSELEEALKNGELTLTEDGPKTAAEMMQIQESEQKLNGGGQHSDAASLLVAPSETQQREDMDEEEQDPELAAAADDDDARRPSESYDAQRVEMDFEPVMTTSNLNNTNSSNQATQRDSQQAHSYSHSSRTASIPIRPPFPPTNGGLSSLLTRDSLPVSTSTSNSRVPSSATFGLSATRRSMEENSAGIPAITKLTLPLNLVRSHSGASSDATTTRSVIGSVKGGTGGGGATSESTKTKLARHASSHSGGGGGGDTKGWESSPTLPKAGLGVEA